MVSLNLLVLSRLSYENIQKGLSFIFRLKLNETSAKNCYAVEHGHKSKPNLHDADVTLLQVK